LIDALAVEILASAMQSPGLIEAFEAEAAAKDQSLLESR
jgi:hypothetical protein